MQSWTLNEASDKAANALAKKLDVSSETAAKRLESLETLKVAQKVIATTQAARIEAMRKAKQAKDAQAAKEE